MTLTLPPELAGLLEEAGGHWPEADEDQLHQLAGSWRTLAGDLRALGAEGTAIARSVAAGHHGESIEAFSSYWREFECNVDEGATAADQTAEAVDAMAKATLGAKSSIIEGLSSAFTQLLEARTTSAAIGVIGPVIGIILRFLAKFIWRVLAALAKYIWRFIVWLFKKISWVFKKIADFFQRLWRKVTRRPKKEPLGKIKGPKEFDPNSLRGRTPDEIRRAIPDNWTKGSSKSGGGEVYRDPANPGRSIRIMPGYPAGSRPDPVTWGPYAVVTQNGQKLRIPLPGNPTL